MEIIFENSRLATLFKNTKAKAKHSAATVSRKTEDAMLSTKLRRQIRDLEEEIDLQLAEVGALVYATHTGTPSSSQEMQQILTYIDDLFEELVGHERQLKILGGSKFCPACDQENAGEHTFCQECGKNLTEEV